MRREGRWGTRAGRVGKGPRAGQEVRELMKGWGARSGEEERDEL